MAAGAGGRPPQAERQIAAKVNGESVTAAEAEREFRQAYGERKLADAERAALLKAALEQVIDRRLVLAYLTKANQAATSQDVDFAVAQFEKDLKSQNLTLEAHLKQVEPVARGFSPGDRLEAVLAEVRRAATDGRELAKVLRSLPA